MDKKAQIRNICIFVVIALSFLWVPELAFEDISETVLRDLILPLQIFSPLLAAIIVRKLISKEGFQDAGLGIRGVKLKYWLLAIFLPLIWNGIAGLLLWAQGFCTINSVRLPPPSLGYILGAIIYLSSEELGWRSYLVQKLAPFGWHIAFIVTGVVWFFWHLENVIGAYSNLGKLIILGGIILLSYVFGWLYLRAKSVWPCFIIHALNNYSQPQTIFKMSKTPSDIQENFAVLVILLIVTVILFSLEHPITGKSIFKHNKGMVLKQE